MFERLCLRDYMYGACEIPDQDYAAKQDVLDLRREMKQDMEKMQDHLIEAMRDMQAEVLRALHNRVSPTDIKLRGHERLTRWKRVFVKSSAA